MMHESIGSTAVTTTTTTTTALLANHQRPVDDPIQKSSSSPTSSRRQIARIDSVCSASPIPVDTIAIAASVTSTANGFGKMQLCSCFAHVPSERHRDVKAWLEGTPWHIPSTSSNGNSISNSISSSTSSSNDISNNDHNNSNHTLLSPLPVRRCLDGCGGCILVSVRSACRHLQELGEKPLDQLLTYMSSTVYPELCRRRRGGKAVWEGLDRLARLLRAFLEPLESRANIAYRLAHLLKDTLLGLLANAQGDVELTDELRGLLAHLEDSSLLSLKVIEHQRSLLVQLMRDVWEVKHRDFSIY